MMSDRFRSPYKFRSFNKYPKKHFGKKKNAREVDEKVLKLTSEYIDDGFSSFYVMIARFVTWSGFHVRFSLRQQDAVIFTIQAFNKVVKRMHAEATNEEVLHRGLVLASMIPSKLRKGIDYFTPEDAPALAAITVTNAKVAKDIVGTNAGKFWNDLEYHTVAARIAFTQDDERQTVLFPFNYWALRQLGSVFLGEYNLCQQANWSWLTLPPAEKKAFMLSQSG
jgi:hypothetical protein